MINDNENIRTTKGSSKMAEGIALQRLAESQLPEDIRIFCDQYATYFINRHVLEWAKEHPIEAKVMAESGYDKLTMDDVAKKLGATKGAIYWYFQNKNALIQELLETIDTEFRQIADDPFFDQMKNIIIPPALNRLVFYDELKKEIFYEIGFLNSPKADIPLTNPKFLTELITILEIQLAYEQKKEQLPSLSDKKTLALSLAVLFSGLQRGEIYTILFFGRTRIQQMWFTAMKKLLNCELAINLIKKYSL